MMEFGIDSESSYRGIIDTMSHKYTHTGFVRYADTIYDGKGVYFNLHDDGQPQARHLIRSGVHVLFKIVCKNSKQRAIITSIGMF